jgi:hypothetical protein
MRAFLEAYQRTGQVSAAAAHAGVSRMTHYRRLKTDRVYATAFRVAEEQVGQELEDEAIRRAVTGVKRPVTYRGKLVRVGRRILYQVEYSDMLLLQLLRRFRPNLYREHVTTETGSAPVNLAEQLAAARKRVLEMRAG